MRVFIFASILSLTFLLTLIQTSPARADYGDTPFSFHASSEKPGCISISYNGSYQNFPDLPEGHVGGVRFYHEMSSDADAVTVNSAFDETTVSKGEYGDPVLGNNEFCGFSGGHYVLKYGLVNDAGQLIRFMEPSEWTDWDNAVDVE